MPLGKVVRVFPDPQGVIRTAEVEGERVSLCSVIFLMPLELDCQDNNEGNSNETETAGNYQEVSYSEADEPPAAESIFSGHEGPISLGIDSSSSGPNESPLAEPTDMQLSGLAETDSNESVDTPERKIMSPPRIDVGASRNVPTVPRVAVSRQSPIPSCEAAPLNTQPEESTTQRQPRQGATRQRQLMQELMQQDLL